MVTNIELLSSVTYSNSRPFGKLTMSHRYQRIRQFNHAELHPYSSQYNPSIKPESNCQVPPSVGVVLFALPVGGVNIWPIGRGIPWGNHGGLPVVTSCHALQTGLYIWSAWALM